MSALWVATWDSLTTPPNLNADFLDYYYYGDMQAASSPAPKSERVDVDIRSMRKVRGEDRGLFWRVENNEAFLMQVGMSLRALLVRS